MLCESQGGRPGLQSLINLQFLSVDVKQHFSQPKTATNYLLPYASKVALGTVSCANIDRIRFSLRRQWPRHAILTFYRAAECNELFLCRL